MGRTALQVLADELNGDEPAARHLLQALAREGHINVQLPNPDEVGDYGAVWHTTTRIDGPVGTVQYRPQTRQVEIRDDYEYSYPPEAVEVDGLVLLAAARWAATHG